MQALTQCVRGWLSNTMVQRETWIYCKVMHMAIAQNETKLEKYVLTKR